MVIALACKTSVPASFVAAVSQGSLAEILSLDGLQGVLSGSLSTLQLDQHPLGLMVLCLGTKLVFCLEMVSV